MDTYHVTNDKYSYLGNQINISLEKNQSIYYVNVKKIIQQTFYCAAITIEPEWISKNLQALIL